MYEKTPSRIKTLKFRWVASVLIIAIASHLVYRSILEEASLARKSFVAGQIFQINHAIMWYKQTNGRELPEYITTPNGKRGVSWRVLILPFVGHEVLYRKFNLELPWDAPENLKNADEMPSIFRKDNAGVAGNFTCFRYSRALPELVNERLENKSNVVSHHRQEDGKVWIDETETLWISPD